MRYSHPRRGVRFWLGVTGALLALQLTGAAQQTVPFENGSPIAPAGFEPQPIPAEPIEYDTAEVMRIRVVPVARGLVNPWGLTFRPDPSTSLGAGPSPPRGASVMPGPEREGQ